MLRTHFEFDLHILDRVNCSLRTFWNQCPLEIFSKHVGPYVAKKEPPEHVLLHGYGFQLPNSLRLSGALMRVRCSRRLGANPFFMT